MFMQKSSTQLPVPDTVCVTAFSVAEIQQQQNSKIPSTLEVKMHVEMSFEGKASPPLYFYKQGTNHLVSWTVSTFFFLLRAVLKWSSSCRIQNLLNFSLPPVSQGSFVEILGDSDLPSSSLMAVDSSTLDRQPRRAATAHGAPPKKTGPAGV